jgi:hypothetical protein
VSAFTPHFQQTQNTTHRRTPEESPHNPEHPATPEPPFAFGAVTPATSIKRRETRRQRIPDPFHYDKPLTTRITHLTAMALYGQGPPTTRITHLTAMVLYRNPTSQGHPETTPPKKGKKRKNTFPFGTSAGRSRRQLPRLDTFAPTPPGFFAGQIPSFVPSGFFKSSFTRTLQQPLELDQRPPTPPPPVSVVAETPALKANFSRFTRKLLTPLELNEHPATPPSVIPPAALDLLLEANLVEFKRQIQKLPQLDQRPPTPPRFFEGFWPASDPFPTFKVSFDRKLLTPAEIDEYPPPPPSADLYSAIHKSPAAIRSEFKRTLQTLGNPHVYPATPPGFRWPRPPMPTHKVAFDRKLQTLAHNEEYPATPPGFFEGQWPSHKPPPTLKASFARQLKLPPEHNVYPLPPVSADDYAGYTPVPKFTQSFTRQLQALGNPHVYPATPPGFRWPRPPMPTHKVAFARHLQQLPQLDERPLAAAIQPPQPAVESFNVSFTRDRQELAHNSAYPPTPPSIIEGMAPWAARSIRRRETRRKLQPVWDPSSNIPELFVPGLTICWRADPINLVWKACADGTTWFADPLCD